MGWFKKPLQISVLRRYHNTIPFLHLPDDVYQANPGNNTKRREV